jgi:hypothetical protein
LTASPAISVLEGAFSDGTPASRSSKTGASCGSGGGAGAGAEVPIVDGGGAVRDAATLPIVVEVGGGGDVAEVSLSPGGTTEGVAPAAVDFSNPALEPRKNASARAARRPAKPTSACTPVKETW